MNKKEIRITGGKLNGLVNSLQALEHSFGNAAEFISDFDPQTCETIITVFAPSESEQAEVNPDQIELI